MSHGQAAAEDGLDRAVKAWLNAEPCVPDAIDCERASAEGVQWLLQPGTDPAAQRQQLEGRKRLLQLELAEDRWLPALLAAAAARGLQALVIKGGALSRWLYAERGLRPRTDLDLWIPAAQRQAWWQFLDAQGWRRTANAWGLWQQPEASFTPPEATLSWPIDLHWQISGRPALSKRLAFDEFYRRARRLAEHGDLAVPDPADSLLIAVAHAFGHHRSGRTRLIWLLDMALLWRQMSPEAKLEVSWRARAHGIASLVRSALVEAHRRLDIELDPDWLAAMDSAAQSEAWSSWLADAPSDWRLDWRSCDGSQRLAIVKERLWPPADYLRQRYASRAPDWWLRLRRLIDAARRRS